ATGGTAITLFGGGGNDDFSPADAGLVALLGGEGQDGVPAVGGEQITLFGGDGADTLTAEGATDVTLFAGNGSGSQLNVGDDLRRSEERRAGKARTSRGDGSHTMTATDDDQDTVIGGDRDDDLH